MKKKNILIFGAGGILGNIIFNSLLDNYNVIGFSHKSIIKKNIFKIFYKKFSNSNTRIINNADVIINCIGENSDKKKMQYKNIQVLKLICDCIGKSNKKKIFIHLSTCGVYGSTIKNKISENVIPIPNNLYSRSKLRGEKVLKENLKDNIKLIILRPSQVIGSNMRNISLNKLIYFLKKGSFFINNRKSEFSYIFDDDLILSIKSIIKKKNLRSNIYNISNNIKYHKLVKIILKKIDNEYPILNVHPIFIKLLISILSKVNIKTPLNYQSFNSLRSNKVFISTKIQKDLNLKNFININSETLKKFKI